MLKEMGFTTIRDLNNSPAFHLSGHIEVKNGQEVRSIVNKIYKTKPDKIHGIHVSIKS